MRDPFVRCSRRAEGKRPILVNDCIENGIEALDGFESGGEEIAGREFPPEQGSSQISRRIEKIGHLLRPRTLEGTPKPAKSLLQFGPKSRKWLGC